MPDNSDNNDKDPLDKFVESRLTEERLDNIWDRLQGRGNRSGEQVRGYGVSEFIRDLWITCRVTGVLHKTAWGVGVVGVALLAVLLLRGGEITLTTPSTWQTAANGRLPGSLQFRVGREATSLRGAALRLSGKLSGQPRAGGGLTILDATFAGQQADGTSLRFVGSLVLTNAPGVVNIRGRGDFLGGTLVGEATVGTNAPIKVEQPYLP